MYTAVLDNNCKKEMHYIGVVVAKKTNYSWKFPRTHVIAIAAPVLFVFIYDDSNK